jgi:hypothetical protein
MYQGTLTELASEIDHFILKCFHYSTGSSEWIPVIAQLMIGYGSTQRLRLDNTNAIALADAPADVKRHTNAVDNVVSLVVSKVLAAASASTENGADSADSAVTLCSKALPLESVFLDSALVPGSNANAVNANPYVISPLIRACLHDFMTCY